MKQNAKKKTTSENRGWRENSESDIFGRMELWPLSRMFYSLCLALKFSWQCLLFRTVILQKRSLGLPIHPASCPASFPGFSSVWENMRLRAIAQPAIRTLSVAAKFAGKTGRFCLCLSHLSLRGTKIAPFAPDYESARRRLATRQPVGLEYLNKRSAL